MKLIPNSTIIGAFILINLTVFSAAVGVRSSAVISLANLGACVEEEAILHIAE